MDTYRYCLLGPSGRVDVAREFECESLADARLVARRVLQTDPLWTGIELWLRGRRVHMEFSETQQRPEPRRKRLRLRPAYTEISSGSTPGDTLGARRQLTAERNGP